MIVKIQNLGVIKEAAIDLKPLTVFIGHNNMGKTWAAYTLSAILGSYGYNKYLNAYLDGKTQQKYSPLDAAFQQLVDKGNTQIDLVRFAKEYTEAYINDVARLAPEWMQSFMATERIGFKDLQVHFDLSDLNVKLLDKMKNRSIRSELSLDSQTQDTLVRAVKEEDSEKLYFYSKGDILAKLPGGEIKRFICENIFQMMHKLFYLRTNPFPTERTLSFVGSVKKIKQGIESSIDNSKQVRFDMPGSTRNFVDIMKIASSRSPVDRKEEIDGVPNVCAYIELAKFLEKEILWGDVDFEPSGMEKELLYQPEEGVKLEMPIVSSMVKELAPLVLYLRYLAMPNDLIIIDEPEMNLHPAAQVEMTEFLAMLANAGLHVLITTHSPYIVDHVANLMQAAKHEKHDEIKELFYLKQTDAFIPQKKTSVYLFEEGTAKDIVDKEGVIDWGTFSDVSDDVSRIYSKLI